MKLYIEIFKLVIRKYLFRQSTGLVVRKFAARMGLAYEKFAQILAMQNFGHVFTEEDRRALSSICDDINPVGFKTIRAQLEQEYGDKLDQTFVEIDERPLGSASVSQVHRAVLKSGEVVVLKVKRRDVAKTVERDVAQIRKLMHRFGGFVGMCDSGAGDVALDLYLGWLAQEVDFPNEVKNIRIYQDFADSVNGKVPGAKEIKLPKVYSDLCTKNVIVMEFIPYRTVNQLELTPENKARISEGINSYLQLSFYAMFHDLPIIFHGDPHSGNLYLDDAGNIGFLDMGLLCIVPKREEQLLKDFFFCAYTGNADKLYNILIEYGDLTASAKESFRREVEEYCAKTRAGCPVTSYFTDMVEVVTGYNLVPPEFLFPMAKPFLCLNGIGNFVENSVAGNDLLRRQVAEWLLRRSVNDCRALAKDGAKLVPRTLEDLLDKGVTGGAVEGVARVENLLDQAHRAVANFREALEIGRQEAPRHGF